MKYTIETLTEINQRFVSSHYSLEQYDVDMVNEYVNLIEKSRSKNVPSVGDLVLYTNEYGDYYSSAHIEQIENGEVNLCEQASVYVYSDNKATEGFCCSSSGGAWINIPIENFHYVGTKEKRFWHFGHLGACADGGVDFYATVNVWECSLNKQPFSTKTHDKYYLTISKEKNEFGYNYHVYKNMESSKAFKTEIELQAWLRTVRAVIVPGYQSYIVWGYKEVKHHVSPEEYESINGLEDVMLMNGKRWCKRIYDDENCTLHTYFVWYWDAPEMGDFYQQATKQNEIRRRYELACPEEYSYALNELRMGTVKPLNFTEC